MSLSEEKKKLRNKVETLKEKAMFMEVSEYDARANTKETRNQYMKLVHYYHVLHQMGEEIGDEEQRFQALANALLREKIIKIKDSERQRKEVVQFNLVSAHTGAYNIAEHFYEKASKTLCQMMITIMDYILQEKADMSVLYTAETESKRSYFSLLDEIIALNEDYLDGYFYLCAFDYCTEKIADYMEIKEYKKVIKEHNRIIENGLPGKVSHVLQTLKQIIADDRVKIEIFYDIERAYVSEPPYDEKILESCYKKVIETKYDNNIEQAMSEFGNLVIDLDYAYANCF